MCGFSGDLCPKETFTTPLLISLAISVSLLSALVSAIGYMARKKNKVQTEEPPSLKKVNRIKKLSERISIYRVKSDADERMQEYINNLPAYINEILHKVNKTVEETNQMKEEIEKDRKRHESLLNEMLPNAVSRSLLRGESVTTEMFESVTIYFSDIVGFTDLSANSSPQEVLNMLHDLYTVLDKVTETFDVYKVGMQMA